MIRREVKKIKTDESFTFNNVNNISYNLKITLGFKYFFQFYNYFKN